MRQDKDKVQKLKKRLEALKAALGFDGKKKELKEIETKSAKLGFWEDKEKATALMKKMGKIGGVVSAVENLIEDLEILETQDSIEEWQELEKQIEKLELKTYLNGKYDDSDAILTVRAGQGGTEAMDWAQMLQRMYIKYCDKKNWKWELIDQSLGEEAGVKNVTLAISGDYAYGYLKGEIGAHRLVRQSPFNADKLRQTSFALVEVLPQIKDDSDLEIRNDDLEWNFFRASSHGGQNVQKVSSAARLRHKPTDIVVTCQSQRTQEQNRKIAFQLLKAKIWAQKEIQIKEKEKNLKGEYKPASWGNQIRSYVLHPYKMIKDLRTGIESNEPTKILDGDLDDFVSAQVKM